uniref:Uncharacterized protein n=1 Tax=Pinguiococcus pyrenoidosus TaxID=172671 RepID=A0A7R9YBX4_9STRA|mmetsp:Transcript_17382/g.66205  ORF Transcript_17382/g.66205 Transcript_17382/m.66205 type:complete len:149 (+) Transcript_17382:70-516(+)
MTSCCPPLRYCVRGARNCCLKPHERELLDVANELFDKVNPDKTWWPASCCVNEKLGNAETMLLLRTLRDDKNEEVEPYRELMVNFADNLREATGEHTEGGRAITINEFSDALIKALNLYMADASKKVTHAVKLEYQEMQREIGGTSEL